jgi:hypothetical protein
MEAGVDAIIAARVDGAERRAIAGPRRLETVELVDVRTVSTSTGKSAKLHESSGAEC